ncbi:hypothetical protein EF294_02570 [Gordonia oryzae]|uniref:Uncharacterized protein n=1 Tax=Gordonia oryzae TaxID=2487349 RepID=A0A3N4GW54_9ACTN|nr:hypothetical protein EF294_02570 [Gordonia oryzae]
MDGVSSLIRSEAAGTRTNLVVAFTRCCDRREPGGRALVRHAGDRRLGVMVGSCISWVVGLGPHRLCGGRDCRLRMVAGP